MVYLSNLYNTTKTYLLLIMTLIGGVFAALFFYEKHKAEVSDVLLKEEKLNTDLAKLDGDIAKNNQGLADEEDKRKALEKGTNETVSTDTIVNFLNTRK